MSACVPAPPAWLILTRVFLIVDEVLGEGFGHELFSLFFLGWMVSWSSCTAAEAGEQYHVCGHKAGKAAATVSMGVCKSTWSRLT